MYPSRMSYEDVRTQQAEDRARAGAWRRGRQPAPRDRPRRIGREQVEPAPRAPRLLARLTVGLAARDRLWARAPVSRRPTL